MKTRVFNPVTTHKCIFNCATSNDYPGTINMYIEVKAKTYRPWATAFIKSLTSPLLLLL